MSNELCAWAAGEQTGNRSRKLLLMILAEHADERGCCSIAQEQLAKLGEMSTKSVARHLWKLEDDGFIIRWKRGGTGNGRVSDDYKLLVPEMIDAEWELTDNLSGSGGGLTDNLRGANGQNVLEEIMRSMLDIGEVLYGVSTMAMGCLDPRAEITAGAKLIAIGEALGMSEGEINLTDFAASKDALDRYCALKAWRPPLAPDFAAGDAA